MSTWFRGREALHAFLTEWPLSGEWRWKHVPSHANGQLAVGSYSWYEETGTYRPFALDVLTLRGPQIADITSFITRLEPASERLHLARWPEEPEDSRRLVAFFERFGLPEELPA
jgi:RNA polymerase sigma-70 factor (ECF subfamily)